MIYEVDECPPADESGCMVEEDPADGLEIVDSEEIEESPVEGLVSGVQSK